MDAIEIGARVLEREQSAVDAEFVRNEFEKVSREVETAFTDKARVVAEFFGTKVDEVFGAENGHLAKELERLFGDGSTAAVQHQLREIMRDQSARMREDLLRQFSSADGSNPLADFKAAHLRAAREAATRQESQLEGMREQMVALEARAASLRSEREKALPRSRPSPRAARPRAGPTRRPSPKRWTRSRARQGDDCDAVGDFRGGGGRKGDVVVDIDGCAGASRGRIVFEAKHARRSARRRWRSSRRRWPSARPTTASGSSRPRTGCRRGRRRCARSAATSCSWSSTPRTGRGWRWRSRTRWRARGC